MRCISRGNFYRQDIYLAWIPKHLPAVRSFNAISTMTSNIFKSGQIRCGTTDKKRVCYPTFVNINTKTQKKQKVLFQSMSYMYL